MNSLKSVDIFKKKNKTVLKDKVFETPEGINLKSDYTEMDLKETDHHNTMTHPKKEHF